MAVWRRRGENKVREFLNQSCNKGYIEELMVHWPTVESALQLLCVWLQEVHLPTMKPDQVDSPDSGCAPENKPFSLRVYKYL